MGNIRLQAAISDQIEAKIAEDARTRAQGADK